MKNQFLKFLLLFVFLLGTSQIEAAVSTPVNPSGSEQILDKKATARSIKAFKKAHKIIKIKTKHLQQINRHFKV